MGAGGAVAVGENGFGPGPMRGACSVGDTGGGGGGGGGVVVVVVVLVVCCCGFGGFWFLFGAGRG